jgi:hypothetical protein
MTTEKDIFLIALQLTEPEARSAYLTQACRGDAGLRRRVEILLRTYDRLGDFMARSPVEKLADALNRLGLATEPSPRRGRRPRSGDTAIH